MRSSKNRSRSKGNRNRPAGNIVNRVFDSSGPEGKVRGTPQQIIDKYNQLARDAQLGNDRVAAENFQQHAEHYLRLLGEAQREQDARRDQNQGNGQQGGQQGGQQQGGQPQGNPQPQERQQSDGGEAAPRDREERAFDKVMDRGGDGDSTLVETPEDAPKPRRSRTRRPRKGETDGGEAGSDEGQGRKGAPEGDGDGPPREAAE